MRKIDRRQVLIAGAGLLAAPSVLSAQSALTKIRFTLDWKLQGVHAVYFLARDKGYFRDEGLDVLIDQGEGSGATTPRVMSGAYDAGFGDINAIVEHAAKRQGESPIMVYQYYNRPPFIIVVKKSSPIVNLKDFEGRVVGAPAGSAAARLIPALARLNGIDDSKIKMQNMQLSLQEQMLVKDQIDGVSSYDNTVYINLILQGQDPDKDFRWFRFGDYGLNLYANGIMVSQKMAKEKPEQVRGLVRAINRATKEVAANVDAAMAVLMKVEPLLNEKLEKRRVDYCYRETYMSAETDANGFGDVDDIRLEAAINIVADAFSLPRKPDVGEIFDRSFLPPKAERTFKYTST